MFYPGSKQKIKVFDSGKPAPPLKTEQEQADLGKGRELAYGGELKTFYTVGSLAFALNRRPGTMRKWESEGIIPRSTFTLPSQVKDKRGNRRLYTEEQIMGLRQIALEEGLLEPNVNGKWKKIEDTKFKERALKLFKDLED